LKKTKAQSATGGERMKKISKIDKAILTIKKGTQGKPIGLKKKQDPYLEDIAKKLCNILEEYEFQGNEKIFFGYEINEKINSLGFHPSKVMPKMRKECFLVLRTVHPESYFVFIKTEQGRRIKDKLHKKAA